jgi:putative ribosome biogenesis GTPase RsgA
VEEITGWLKPGIMFIYFLSAGIFNKNYYFVLRSLTVVLIIVNYFLSVFFRLRPLDIAFMKAVHHKVNIVPVLAKADTLTKQEVQRLKKRIILKLDKGR